MSTTTKTRESPHRSPSPERSLPQQETASSYLSYPVAHVFAGIRRRFTDSLQSGTSPSSLGEAKPTMRSSNMFAPHRTISPFHPPPLTSLTLEAGTGSHSILPKSLAEEVRLLLPPRLQLVDSWRLAYSLERDGASLATLYHKCEEASHRSQRAGYVLVVKDSSSASNESVFGAYLTDPPHPSSHFYGTGECFLWKASTLPSVPLMQVEQSGPFSEHQLELSGLPPPPSANTTNSQRSTTLQAEPKAQSLREDMGSGVTARGTSTPGRIRFKAFPYSGVNDYMMFCETGFLSIGGGDGHYGLWLDNSFERGVSGSCPTFGNEPLCDDSDKFDVLGVEVWYVGS